MFNKVLSSLFIVSALITFSSAALYAQKADTTKSRWFINSGFGYYNTGADGKTGNIFYSEVGYQLSTGYNVGVGFGLGDIFAEYDEIVPLFKDMRMYENYYLLRLFINRPFKFGSNNNHQFKVGSGFVYIQPRYSYPQAFLKPIYDNQGNLIRQDLIIRQRKSTSTSIELGLPLVLEYGYSFGPLTIGARFETHLLYAANFGGFIASPQISLDF